MQCFSFKSTNVSRKGLSHDQCFGKGIEGVMGLEQKDAIDVVSSFERGKLREMGWMGGMKVENVDASISNDTMALFGFIFLVT